VIEPPNASAPLAYWEGVPAFPKPYCEEAGLDFMAHLLQSSWFEIQYNTISNCLHSGEGTLQNSHNYDHYTLYMVH